MPPRDRTTRRAFLAHLGALGAAVPFGEALNRQQPRVRRIGLAFGDDPEGGVNAFKEALRARGHQEGRTLTIDARGVTTAPPGTNVAADLARADVELLVVHSLPLALAARAANPNMPLVIVTTPGMISNGFAASLERPGGNSTGIDELPPGVTATRLQLLKTAAPAISRVALLSTTPGRGGHEAQLADAEAAAAKLNVEVKPYRAASPEELERGFAAIRADQMNGLLNFQGGFSYVNRDRITRFASEQRLPAIYQATVFAAAGGLMAWAPDLVEQFRMAAEYVDQILNGARPGDLPVRHPPRYYLTINASAAKKIALTLPPSLLAKADRILP
jgi:putative ABC transport system substrate-binding protein